MVKIYLAGPMTGIRDHNYPAFHAAAGQFRAAGFEVVSPAELQHVDADNYKQCLRVDMLHLLACDVVVLLPEWESSKGAGKERQLAIDTGIPVRRAEEFDFFEAVR